MSGESRNTNTWGQRLGRPENGRPYEDISLSQGAAGGLCDSSLHCSSLIPAMS